MKSLPVLLYYRFHPELSDNYTVSIDAFRRQLAFLKENDYSSISCKQLYGFLMNVDKLPDKPFMITFDEGHISQYSYAMSILEEFGFTAIFFVYGDWVLSGSSGKNRNFQVCMDINQLRDLREAGFEIGINGYSGMNFKASKLTDIQTEISKSMILFNRFGLILTNALAYPYGESHTGFLKREKMYRMLKQQKVMLAFNNSNKVNNLFKTNRLNINRIEIKGKDSYKDFLTKITGRAENGFKTTTIYRRLKLLNG